MSNTNYNVHTEMEPGLFGVMYTTYFTAYRLDEEGTTLLQGPLPGFGYGTLGAVATALVENGYDANNSQITSHQPGKHLLGTSQLLSVGRDKSARVSLASTLSPNQFRKLAKELHKALKGR